MKAKASNTDLIMLLLKGRTLLVLLVLFAFFSIAAPNFLSVSTLLLIGKHVALYGILAVGMTYVIITSGIDLSVGAVVGLTGMVVGGLIQEGLTLEMFGVTLYFSVPMVFLIAIALGALVGLVNGLIITKLKVPAFITTLGTMYVLRGFANLRSNGATFSSLSGNEALGNTGFSFFGATTLGIPNGLLIFALIALIAGFVLNKTSFGWHTLAIGGNAKAAKFSGVKVDKNTIVVYIIAGVCSAIVGVITTSQLMAAHPATGESWEMNAIAAAVLGGTSMSGGIGSIGGTVLGAFIIGVINDGMVMCGVSEFWQMVIRGCVVILAVVIDVAQRRLQAKIALQAKAPAASATTDGAAPRGGE